jgi:hypothetical protein
MQPQHPAMQLHRPATAGRDVRTELQRKEHELSNLRMTALRALEQQVIPFLPFDNHCTQTLTLKTRTSLCNKNTWSHMVTWVTPCVVYPA